MRFGAARGRAGSGKLGRCLALAAVGLSLGACGGGGEEDPDDGPVQPRFGSIQAEIFTPSCSVSTCHDSASQQAGQDLSAGAAYDNIVNVPSSEDPARRRVEPGFPERSYLVAKLRGGPNITGGRMPLGRPPLGEERIQAIEEWIRRGAARD
jgi:hypothetical protein